MQRVDFFVRYFILYEVKIIILYVNSRRRIFYDTGNSC